MSLSVTFATVVTMLLYCIPGYLLVKGRLLSAKDAPSFAVYLLYVSTPCLIIDSMQQITYTPYIARYMLISLVVSVVMMAGGMGALYLVLRRKQAEVPYRICVCGAAMGNVGFMGLPLLRALLPDYPQMLTFTSMFILTLNVLMWSMSSWIMTRDKRYISLRKALVNPAAISVMLGLILFLARFRLPDRLLDMVSLMSRMCTPISMLVLGMRLASAPIKPIFTNRLQYATVALKLVVLPLIMLALCRLFPLERDFIRGVFILSCVPAGNTVLSFSELLGEGQDVAANVVLLSTMLSMLTIPAMLLLI
ncbi:MAG: AEC family transporter [Clostridia bacterium]|nr:AEC family transporter [Clostridia bacterium]